MPLSSALPEAPASASRPFARLAVATIASLLIASAVAADPPLSFAESLRIAVDRRRSSSRSERWWMRRARWPVLRASCRIPN